MISLLEHVMKSWSIYNRPFYAERYGYFLYNALSGRLLQYDEPHSRLIESIRSGGGYSGYEDDQDFMETLDQNGFILDKRDEVRMLMRKREMRDQKCADASQLVLCICPTLQCNFRCAYCYELSQSDSTVMSLETIGRLIDFIKRHEACRKLSITWYGGEPTMAFEVVETLTERFLDLFPNYDCASLVTNAYLLDREKTEKLNRLKITNVQVTLDGPASTHDRRRPLKSGASTYRRIIENLDILMNSSYNGSCSIRVNIDRSNRTAFSGLRSELLDRYKNKPLTVYPYRLSTTHCRADAEIGEMGRDEWADFIVRGYHENDIVPERGFYPDSQALNTCMASMDHGYVVAPNGELYKCWKDVGRKSMIAGSVFSSKPDERNGIASRYRTVGDPFLNSECLECRVFPICGGGCVKKRLEAQQDADSGIDFCSPYKESLEVYLAASIDIYHKREICDIIFGRTDWLTMDKGYRLIDPYHVFK